jgi:DNA-binding CsgD family transcriptional regulator
MKEDFCFSIMPFKGYFNDYYSKIYSIAIKEAGLQPLRADDIYTPGTIINDIWESIQKSKVILADLTQQNANVFYELGLAHASVKPVILISETIEDIPFDLRALRIILYDKNVPDWGSILKENIIKAIKDTIEAPLKTILPTFLNVTKDKTSVTESEKILLELKSDIESLKRGQETSKNKSVDYTLDGVEIQILKLISQGLPQNEIGKELFLSPSSIERILTNLKRKFNANNNLHLVKLASDFGLI